MANTYVKIASVTVGAGGAANIEFTSIPATFDDLVVKLSGRSSRAGEFRDGFTMSLNGSTANFSYRMLEATGSSPGSYSASTGLIGNTPAATSSANTFGSAEIYLPNYAGSTNKSYSGDSTQPSNSTTAITLNMVAGLWSNSAAITSLRITSDISPFVQHSTAVLYGIKRT